MKKYIVMKIPKYLSENFEEVFFSDSTEEVASYMWGQYIGEYAIYKNEVLAKSAHICSEVSELKDYLEHIYPQDEK